MSHDALITSIDDWLVDQALGAPQIVHMYREVCEQLFAIGAGEKIVGAVDYSDYPEAARPIPQAKRAARAAK